MNLTLHFVLLGMLLSSYTCPTSTRQNRARRKHRKAVLTRFQGVRFITATHYLPMNFTTLNKLVDMRGNASGVALNGVKVSTADQIGQVLSLDGKDDFIELNGIRDRCIVDPTNCTEGLSVAFWIKYTKGKFIISSGGYVTSNNGPGFRFICQGCAKNSGPQAHTSGTFLLELSTETGKWKIHLDSIPFWWFHFAFTWNRYQGLKFYKNGKFVLGTRNSEKVRRYNDAPDELLTIGKANSLMAMFAHNSLGEFSIGHLAIWTYELSAFNIEIAFMSALTTTIKTLFCCNQLKADPCITNPCHDGATCQRMDRGDKYQCICPDINHHRRCSGAQRLSEHCEDKSERCNELASQDGYCDYHWRRMKDICPKACKLCASHQSSELATTSLHQASLVPNSSRGSHNTQATLSTREAVPTTAVLARLENGNKKDFTQELLILIICAGVGGLILITIVLSFIFTRFYRQRKGEFVPDKSYPNSHNKENGEANGEDVENIASFIDPYTQITDVPHKPTRGHSSGGGSGGGGKKQRKPMGVKVTYKPPEWD